MSRTIKFTIEYADITEYEADVVVLKYARDFHGADQAVALKLSVAGVDIGQLQAPDGEYRIAQTASGIPATYVLYVGVPRLGAFRYDQIQWFAAKSLVILADELPDTKHIAMTPHGANYGLDENESLIKQFQGLYATLKAGHYPTDLERIAIVERNKGRVARLNVALEQFLEREQITDVTLDAKQGAFLLAATDPLSPTRERRPAPAAVQEEPPAPSAESKAPESTPTDAKPHAFVAMPFRKEMDDTFYYGIQKPIHEAGLLCERVDQEAVEGEIMEYVRNRIETAAVVVADLSMANPNVYLEVGYAWGKGRPTVLVVRDEKELQFDVRGQQCLTYNNSIRSLEEMLSNQLKKMMLKGIVKK